MRQKRLRGSLAITLKLGIDSSHLIMHNSANG
jgi:hypothetical protein